MFQTNHNNFIKSEHRGTIYRWENGQVSHATGYSWPTEPVVNPIQKYRAITMFYNGGFILADDNASTRDMRNETYPRDRWFDLRFRHEEYVTRLDLTGEETQMTCDLPPQLERSLGLGSYCKPQYYGRQRNGLSGNLAIVLALISFSCSYDSLDEVLMASRSGWNDYGWKPHRYGRGARTSQPLPELLLS